MELNLPANSDSVNSSLGWDEDWGFWGPCDETLLEFSKEVKLPVKWACWPKGANLELISVLANGVVGWLIWLPELPL